MGGNQSKAAGVVLTTGHALNDQIQIRSKYRISHKMIGKGAFAEVYKGNLTSDKNTKVAIKWYKKKRLFDKEIKAIKDEVNVLSTLDHPNIVKLHEVFQDEKYIYIVMEYLKGRTLSDWLTKNEKPMSEEEATYVIHQLVSAISYWHSNNIVHRDIKLDNIIIDDNLKITLIDFGLSKNFSKSKIMKSTTGSPLFMAPEVLHKKYSNKCDVWSIGVVMYVLLSKRLPFSGECPADILSQSKVWDLAFEKSFWKSISSEAKDLISNMIKFDDKERFTCEQILKHEWFESSKDESTDDSLEDSEVFVLDSLRKFKCDKSFQNLINSLLIKFENKRSLEKLCHKLNKMDKNMKEEELFDKIRSACKKFGINISKGEIRDILNSTDIKFSKTPKPSKTKCSTLKA